MITSPSTFVFAILFLIILSFLLVINVHASPLLDQFLSEGFYSAPHIKAVDEHPKHCLRIKGDRLVPYKPDNNNNNNIKFLPGSAFVITDLCPLGHTGKDAPLMMSWALDAEGFTKEELMKDVFHHNHHIAASDEKESSSYSSTSSLRSPPLRYVIYGNMCMSKDKSIKPNKRTPVFHSVLWDWFKAVKNRMIDLRNLLKRENANDPITEYHFIDFEKKEVPSMCFENIVTRHEKWRWMREEYHADQFRIALWNHFNISDEFQNEKIKKRNSESEQQRSLMLSTSCDSKNNNNNNQKEFLQLLLNHLSSSKNALMIQKVEKKINNENHKKDKQFHLRNLINSLRSAFPSSSLPLRVTVLVRDEDRHFEEQKVGDYIQSIFPPSFIEVRKEKFDSLKGDKHYVPPSHKQQLQILFDTDILIAAHGAGLSSVLAMRPGSAVIELFPHNFKYYMYEEASEIARVHYRRWESQIVWPKRCCSISPASRSAEQAKFEKPLHLNGLGARACKKCDTYVSEELIEELVGQAIREVAIAQL